VGGVHETKAFEKVEKIPKGVFELQSSEKSVKMDEADKNEEVGTALVEVERWACS